MIKKDSAFFRKTPIILIICTVCCLLWGSAFPFIKIGYKSFNIDSADTMSVMLFAGIRFFFAGIIAIAIGSFLNKKLLLPKKSNLFRVLKLAMVQTVIQYFFFYIGLANTTGVKSSIIDGASSFFAILIACFIFRQEKFSRYKLIGCILGLFGIVLINFDKSLLKFDFSLLGDGFILISTVSYAFSSVLIKQYSKYENPVTLSGWQFVVGGLIMAVIGFSFGGRLSLSSPTGIALIIYLALLSAVAYSLWGILLKYNSVSKITVFGFMIPIFGFFLSALILKEGYFINYLSIISLLSVSIGIYIVNKFEN